MRKKINELLENQFYKLGMWMLILILIFTSVPWIYDSIVNNEEVKEETRPRGPEDKRKAVKKVMEIKEKRTSHSTTWRNSDLTETVEISSAPMFYQEHGKKEWKEINSNIVVDKAVEEKLKQQPKEVSPPVQPKPMSAKSLSSKNNTTVAESIPTKPITAKATNTSTPTTNQPTSNADMYLYRNQANKFTAHFAQFANTSIFKFVERDYFVSYSIAGAKPVEGQTKENSITYPGVFPDIDAQYHVNAEGVKEDFILHKKTDLKSFTFELNTNLEPKLVENQIQFFDKKTKELIWKFEAPYMIDAADAESHKNSYELIQENNKTLLVVHLDQAFLQDPATKYPVKVDPTITMGGTINNTIDSYVANVSGYTDNNYGGSTELRTGYAYDTGYIGAHRSFVKFPTLPNLNGGLILSAHFRANKYYEPASVDTNISIHRPSKNWVNGTDGIDWENQPPAAGLISTSLFKAGAPNGWYSWNVTSLVTSWYDNPSSNFGLMMKADNETTRGSYRKFYSSDYNSGSQAPRIVITYSPVPQPPTGTAHGYGSGTGTGYIDINWPSVEGATGYKVLIYNGKYYDEIDVGNVTSWTTKGKKIWPTPEQVASGKYQLRLDGSGMELPDDPRYGYRKAWDDPSKPNWFDLRNLVHYDFRIKAYNQHDTSEFSHYGIFVIDDQTLPTKPGKPSVLNPNKDQFTLSWGNAVDTLSGVQKYKVYMGSAPGLNDIANGTETTTNTYTHPTPLDPRIEYHTYVTAVDKSGNVSPVSDTSTSFARQDLDASIVSASIPTNMEAGGKYQIQVTVKNEGLQTWTAANNFMLGSPNDESIRLALDPSEVITSGQTRTFNFEYQAGTQVGPKTLKLQMLKGFTGWIGDPLSQEIQVTDTTPPTAGISINNGQTFTNSPNVSLELKAPDNATGEIQQKIANEDGVYIPYESFTAKRDWVLSQGNGNKSVSVVFKDGSGNESAVATANIEVDTNFPTSTITSPKELDNVSGVFEVRGTATDSDLKEYTLSYRKIEEPDNWVVFHTANQQITDGILGFWNPKGLPTGKYVLRLSVTDQAGNTSYIQKYVWVDPLVQLLGSESYWGMTQTAATYGSSQVNLQNGNLVLGYGDVSLDGRQLDPSIDRIYNSQEDRTSILGAGWRLSVETSITEEPNGDLIYTDEDGTRHRFTKQTDGSYTAPVGLYLNLVKNTDGTYRLSDKDPTGLTGIFNSAGQLVELADKNNNKLVLNYVNGKLSEMVDDVNRKITFTYGSNQMLSQITLFTGNKVKYLYDANNLLKEVQYLDANNAIYRTLKYEYDAYKRLIKTIDPRGNDIVYTYNGLRVTNIASKHTAREAATGQLRPTVMVNESFVYDLTNKTIKITINGPAESSTTQYKLNQAGNVVETIMDPKDENRPNGLHIKTTAVVENHLVKEVTDSKGNKTSREYDSIGNVIQETEPAYTDYDGKTYASPVTRYEYKPGTNLVTKEIDPLGRTAVHEYDDKGNKLSTTDNNGFKIFYEYDSFGNLLKETTERGALYGYLPNFSFEEGDATVLKGWRTTGTWSFETTEKKIGTRSLKLTGNASAETDFISIKTGRLPVRGLAWVKANSSSVTGTLTFYDANKAKISEATSPAVTGVSWQLLNNVANIPANAAFVTYKLTSSGADSVLIDDVWTEEANIVEQYQYSPDGLYLLTEIDPYGRTSKNEYDTAGNKIKETNALNQTATWVYDADRKVIEAIDRLNKKTVKQYDASGNLVKIINPLNQVIETFYDENNRPTMALDPKVTRQKYNNGTPLEPEVISITKVVEYNEFGETVAAKDGKGAVIKTEYDPVGRVSKTIDPLKNYRKFDYDANNNATRVEDVAYDSETNTYFSRGIVRHFYDELNRETAFTDGTGDVSRIVEKSYYDAVDKEVKTVIGEEDVKEFLYDKDDEPIYTKENSNPIVETWALHDGAGNLAISVDKQGSTYQIYDLNENLLESRDEEGKTSINTYNVVGDKTKQVDPNGTVTTWEYDEEGQLKKETVTLTPPGAPEPKLQIQEYGYNEIGLLVTKDVKEQTGVNIFTTKQGTIGYDELGRVVLERWMSEGGKKTEINRLFDNNGNEEKSWLYDQTTPVDPLKDTDGDGYLNSETTSEYDANNRLMKQTVTHSGTSTIHNYKDKDDVETIQTALGSTKVTRNKDDLVSAVQIPNYDGATITYDYNLNENIRTIRAPGVVTDFTYNGGSKVATMKGRNNAGALVVDLAYTYTDTEQISQITNAGVVKGKYTYTTNGFLKTVEANGKTLQYTHDGMGNILKTENLTTGKVKDEFTYIGDNRISERKEYDDTNGNLLGTTSFTFNESGNLSQSIRTEAGTNKKTEQNFTYNNEDQLVSLTKLENGTTTKKVAYEYDQEGNRLVETVDDRIRYEYQRDSKDEIFGIVKWVDEVEESRTYFFRDGDGKLLGLRHNDIEYYYQFNARGDVIALTDPAGNVVVTYDYDEWGNITQITGDQALANANPYRYVGRYGVFYDGETGLYHMGWRDYDPTTGRFIVADTYEGEEDNAVTQNRYLYAEGDPVNNIDPDGNWGSWLQKGWKGIKKAAKTVYNVAVGDSIKTLMNPNSRWYEKVFAAVDIASNFIPGAKLITSGVKAIKAGVKAYKTYKKIKKIAKKVPAVSLKRMRKAKVSVQKSRTVVKGTKKVSKVTKHSKKPTKASSKRPAKPVKQPPKPKPPSKPAPKKQTTRDTCDCFTLNTKVLTDKGQKKIQDLKIGDKVLAKDEKTGKQSYKAVQWLFEKKVKEVYKLYIGKEVIETTGEHPFWIRGKGWVKAKDLKSGDQVEDDEGNLLVVWRIELEKKGTTVYNISVEDFHTFYITDLKVFTHNCGEDEEENIVSSTRPIIKQGTKEWKQAVETIRAGGKKSSNFRVKTLSEAKALLKEARGNLNRLKKYRDYAPEPGNNYRVHPEETGTIDAKHQDLPHIKWVDNTVSYVRGKKVKGKGKGHIFFDYLD